MATELSRDDWNQPRCWSEPSRYIWAGRSSSSRSSSTQRWETPESNQTSRMSVTCSYCVSSTPRRWKISSEYQQSAPCSSTKSAVLCISSIASGCSSLVCRSTNRAMGTPQVLCREIHQSGRFSTIPLMRSSPQPGTQRTLFMASSALERSFA